jgi:hypothetical protein
VQEKNLDYVGHNQNIVIGDWLDEGMGGYYRKQPALVKRTNDFIEVTSKADPEQIVQILQHEYNHMVTQGHSNFSKTYQQYMRDMFFSDEELEAMAAGEGGELLGKEPFPGGGPVYKYLTTPAEINAYLGTNLRHDLVRSGELSDFYDTLGDDALDRARYVADSNNNREKTPVYALYARMLKDRERLVHWLNTYAI